MAEYSLVADGSYAPPPGGAFNEGEPIFSMINFFTVEAALPSINMGPVGEYVRMAPGREGLITITMGGVGIILTDAEATEDLVIPDPCGNLGFVSMETQVTNDFGSRRLQWFLDIQDNMGTCGGP